MFSENVEVAMTTHKTQFIANGDFDQLSRYKKLKSKSVCWLNRYEQALRHEHIFQVKGELEINLEKP